MSSYTFGRCLKLIRYRKVGLQMTLDFTTEMTAREGRATQRVSTISSQHGHDFSKKKITTISQSLLLQSYRSTQSLVS